MTKGPPGLLPLRRMVAFLAIHDRAQAARTVRPAGLLLFAVVAFTWFGVIVFQQPDRLGYFLGLRGVRPRLHRVHRAQRRSGTEGSRSTCRCCWSGRCRGGRWRSPRLAGRGPPGNGFASGCARRDREVLLLLYWFLLPLAVFFLARSRLQLYLLPLFVPLALLLARPLARWPGSMTGGRSAGRRRSRPCCCWPRRRRWPTVPANRDARAMADRHPPGRATCTDDRGDRVRRHAAVLRPDLYLDKRSRRALRGTGSSIQFLAGTLRRARHASATCSSEARREAVPARSSPSASATCTR